MSGGRQSVGELLTEQFYRWELRGRGWPVWSDTVDLEPPFRVFEGHRLPRSVVLDDGVVQTPLSRLAGRILNVLGAPTPPVPAPEAEVEEPSPLYRHPPEQLVEFQIALPAGSKPSMDAFAQCLSSLGYCRHALAFEIIGSADEVVVQISAADDDASQVAEQLKGHFPDAVVERSEGHLASQWLAAWNSEAQILELGLHREFMFPLNSRRQVAVDPLVGICSAVGRLLEGEIGVFQVLFQPSREPWTESIWRAVTTDRGDPFLANAPELVPQTRLKLARPLYAVVARVAARAAAASRTWEIIKGIAGALRAFNNPAGNELGLLDNDDYPTAAHHADLLNRASRRSGMLLNADELVGLAHLPGEVVRSEKLRRVVRRTRRAPRLVSGGGVLLGVNQHDGASTEARLPLEYRARHIHIIGAPGSGKSTLILNLACQDAIEARGFAVLDPHGDLIDQILERLPRERYEDVILFDPSDEEFPIGFNVLSAHSNQEKTLLASDLVGVFRRLATSWGDQMSSVLGNAVLAFLESSKGGTLAELRRFLLEPSYRTEFLRTVEDPDVIYYWEQAHPVLRSNSVGSLVTRLDSFLRPKAIRHIVGQRTSKVDFADIMDSGRIFLAKLPHGAIGMENSFLLGALLVAKFHQLAISRQQIEEESRRPFCLYIDEFQNFATPSMAEVLTGVRKYRLGLVLAHHSLAQLDRHEELAGAIDGGPTTRICFRVGDRDARRLAEGLAHFGVEDLQNLSPGQAVCRVERAEHDFNLDTLLPPEVDREAARNARADLRDLTQRRFGTPRQSVEAELAESRGPRGRVDPFADRAKRKGPEPPDDLSSGTEGGPPKPPSDSPPGPVPSDGSAQLPADESAKELEESRPLQGEAGDKPSESKGAMPPLPGRGGAAHKNLQRDVARIAQERGWRSFVEERLGETGFADVLLKKSQFIVACELSETNRPAYEIQSIRRRLDGGASHVIVLSRDSAHLAQIEQRAKEEIPDLLGVRVWFFVPNKLGDWLDKLDASRLTGAEVVGEVTVEYETVSTDPQDEEIRRSKERDVWKRLFKRFREHPPEPPETGSSPPQGNPS